MLLVSERRLRTRPILSLLETKNSSTRKARQSATHHGYKPWLCLVGDKIPVVKVNVLHAIERRMGQSLSKFVSDSTEEDLEVPDLWESDDESSSSDEEDLDEYVIGS